MRKREQKSSLLPSVPFGLALWLAATLAMTAAAAMLTDSGKLLPESADKAAVIISFTSTLIAVIFSGKGEGSAAVCAAVILAVRGAALLYAGTLGNKNGTLLLISGAFGAAAAILVKEALKKAAAGRSRRGRWS